METWDPTILSEWVLDLGSGEIWSHLADEIKELQVDGSLFYDWFHVGDVDVSINEMMEILPALADKRAYSHLLIIKIRKKQIRLTRYVQVCKKIQKLRTCDGNSPKTKM